jgi:hypothetical protein
MTKFLKNAMLQEVYDWQTIYKTVLEKAFSIISLAFLSFLVLVLKNFVNDPSERGNFFP